MERGIRASPGERNGQPKGGRRPQTTTSTSSYLTASPPLANHVGNLLDESTFRAYFSRALRGGHNRRWWSILISGSPFLVLYPHRCSYSSGGTGIRSLATSTNSSTQQSVRVYVSSPHRRPAAVNTNSITLPHSLVVVHTLYERPAISLPLSLSLFACLLALYLSCHVSPPSRFRQRFFDSPPLSAPAISEKGKRRISR